MPSIQVSSVSVKKSPTILSSNTLKQFEFKRRLLLNNILTQAHSRTPEDPKHPHRPHHVTDLKKKKKNDKGRKENDQRDKKRAKGRGNKRNTGVEPTETFTPTK